MSQPRWDDLHTAEEWADVLDDIAEKLALRYGDYGRHSQLRLAANCIRDLADRCERAAQKAESLALSIIETQIAVAASLESLSKLGPGRGPPP